MKPAAFAYERPASVSEALDLLAAHGEQARVLAGGQSLLPMLKARTARPSLLVDIGRLGAELGEHAVCQRGLRLGALVRQDEVSAADHRLLAEALGHVGNWQTRRVGTIAGIVALANPVSQLAAVCAAAGARATAMSVAGTRVLAAAALFTGAERLRPDELLIAVTFPCQAAAGMGSAFLQVGRRAADTMIAAVAAHVGVTDGRCTHAAVHPVTLGHPGSGVAAAQALIGTTLSEPALRAAGRQAAAEIEPGDDLLADRDYRRAAVAALVHRALSRAVTRATRPSPAPASPISPQ